MTIIAVEADDHETRAAIAARNHRIPITVIPVPAVGPRTKPKALNAALPFARGTFTVIYDAEDRPEPNQLRRALQAFRAGGDDLACVQARLCIDNTADSWLARLFTAEYAGQFDVFLPGLAALRLPLPLGGSSNHFRTAILREVGAWDPYNVTEDADLGMRLARFGYRRTYRLDHLRGSAGAFALAAPAHALVQRLDADLAGAYAPAAPAAARSRLCRVLSRSSSLSAAVCWPRWCIRCSRRADLFWRAAPDWRGAMAAGILAGSTA